MSYTPVTVEQFRGLRLLPEQGEAPGSVSMLNADLSRDYTQVGSRGGLARLGTGTASYHRICPLDGSNLGVLRNNGSGLVFQPVPLSSGTFGTASTAYGGATTISTSTFSPDRDILFGGVTYEVLIAARTGASNEGLRAWKTASGVTDVSGVVGSPRYMAMSPHDQRLAVAHFTSAAATPSGANGSTSTVWFSAPDNPGDFGDDDWVQLDPDNGEEISGMASWREMLFVIKRSALYIFYSTSTDGTGAAVFNYRRLSLPALARHTTSRGGENIVAGADGVYLLLADGIYRTSGDTPQIVSRDITPLFDATGDSASIFPSTGDWTIGYSANRVYLSYQNGSAYRTLVFDCILREWLLWDVSVGASAIPTNVIEWLNTNGLPTGYVAAGAKLFSFTKTATSDDGTAIVSSYQSGFEALGPPGQEKTVRETAIEGIGTPTFSVFTNYGSSDSNAATVTLGTSPATDEGVHDVDYSGRSFSYKLSATTGAWSVARLTWFLREIRPPGMRSV